MSSSSSLSLSSPSLSCDAPMPCTASLPSTTSTDDLLERITNFSLFSTIGTSPSPPPNTSGSESGHHHMNMQHMHDINGNGNNGNNGNGNDINKSNGGDKNGRMNTSDQTKSSRFDESTVSDNTHAREHERCAALSVPTPMISSTPLAPSSSSSSSVGGPSILSALPLPLPLSPLRAVAPILSPLTNDSPVNDWSYSPIASVSCGAVANVRQRSLTCVNDLLDPHNYQSMMMRNGSNDDDCSPSVSSSSSSISQVPSLALLRGGSRLRSTSAPMPMVPISVTSLRPAAPPFEPSSSSLSLSLSSNVAMARVEATSKRECPSSPRRIQQALNSGAFGKSLANTTNSSGLGGGGGGGGASSNSDSMESNKTNNNATSGIDSYRGNSSMLYDDHSYMANYKNSHYGGHNHSHNQMNPIRLYTHTSISTPMSHRDDISTDDSHTRYNGHHINDDGDDELYGGMDMAGVQQPQVALPRHGHGVATQSSGLPRAPGGPSSRLSSWNSSTTATGTISDIPQVSILSGPSTTEMSGSGVGVGVGRAYTHGYGSVDEYPSLSLSSTRAYSKTRNDRLSATAPPWHPSISANARVSEIPSANSSPLLTPMNSSSNRSASTSISSHSSHSNCSNDDSNYTSPYSSAPNTPLSSSSFSNINNGNGYRYGGVSRVWSPSEQAVAQSLSLPPDNQSLVYSRHSSMSGSSRDRSPLHRDRVASGDWHMNHGASSTGGNVSPLSANTTPPPSSLATVTSSMSLMPPPFVNAPSPYTSPTHSQSVSLGNHTWQQSQGHGHGHGSHNHNHSHRHHHNQRESSSISSSLLTGAPSGVTSITTISGGSGTPIIATNLNPWSAANTNHSNISNSGHGHAHGNHGSRMIDNTSRANVTTGRVDDGSESDEHTAFSDASSDDDLGIGNSHYTHHSRSGHHNSDDENGENDGDGDGDSDEVVGSGIGGGGKKGTHSLTHADLYKTEICHNWQKTRNCSYGNKCHYAHGTVDIRARQRIETFKTQPCADPARLSCHVCMYGARCNYCHPGEALRRMGPRAGDAYFDHEYEEALKRDFPHDSMPFGVFV